MQESTAPPTPVRQRSSTMDAPGRPRGDANEPVIQDREIELVAGYRP